jgi:hypothetical protein
MKSVAHIMMLSCLLAACAPPSPAKVEGPPVKSLSSAQLTAALQECNQYGQQTDPRVKYTERYCMAVEHEHDFAPPMKSTAKVDPRINHFN